MKILVVGGGGREHALVHALAGTQRMPQIYAAPGNPGMDGRAECVPIKADDVAGLLQFAL
ncbi:MAG: phosphoribosylamine--glycine ligase, partial [Deltaproteobacteria bacterium]|nr:phosphoribosylamine--glycine ligase [Deltaproteobacteria bacterium]